MNEHQRAISAYNSDLLQRILTDYHKKTRLEHWDIKRVEAITAELRKRKRSTK